MIGYETFKQITSQLRIDLERDLTCLKLNGGRRFLLLRFRPHTVLSLIINPEDTTQMHNIFYPFLRVNISVDHTSMRTQSGQTFHETQSSNALQKSINTYLLFIFLSGPVGSNSYLNSNIICNLYSWVTKIKQMTYALSRNRTRAPPLGTVDSNH